MRARLRTSRSSVARAAAVVVLEDAKELLGAINDRVGPFGFQPRAVVNPAPGHGNGKHPRRLRSADVEGRVADIGSRAGIRSEPLRAEEKRLRVRLVPLGFVAADDGLEEVAERDVGEGQLDRRAALSSNDPEAPPLLVQPPEDVLHAGAGLELVVERLVVCAVDVYEPVDLVGREGSHLCLEPGAADRLQQLLVGVVATEHLSGCVSHRGENDRSGVDDGAVEVEEDGLEAHASIVSAGMTRLRPCPRCRTFVISSYPTRTGTASGTCPSSSSGFVSAPWSTASWTRSSATRPLPRSRSTARRSCSRTTSRCGPRTPAACRHCSTPAASRSARPTSCRTRSSSAASRSSATSCSAAASAGVSKSSRAAPATSPTALATRPSCHRSWPDSASAPCSSHAAWATRSTTSASSSAGAPARPR